MKVIIETVANSEDEAAMWLIRREVFERELGIALAPPEMSDKNGIAHLLARLEPGRDPVGTLSLVDTSGDHQLHESLGLKFDPQARVARFMHLAVLKPFRRQNIPLMLALEAHRRVIAPRGFDYTWLLFNAERAGNSFLSQWLAFTPLAETFISEYGCRRPLVRDEREPLTLEKLRQAEQYLREFQNRHAPTNAPLAQASISA